MNKYQLYRLTLGLLTYLAFVVSTASAQLLDDAEWFERELGDGVTWYYYQFDNLFSAKQSISYVEVDLDNPNVGLEIAYREAATGPSPSIFPRARTSQFAAETPNAVAAINGTFFNTASYNSGNPSASYGGGVTYLRVDGSVIVGNDNPSSINSFGMGFLFNSKDDVEIQRRPTGRWSTVRDDWDNMMINGPVLLEDGVVESYDSTNSFANARHPRTGYGITADNRLILMTVDGRTSQAAGMSCTELALVFQELGAVDAINMDGGGSTTLWGAGEPFNGVLNYPSDNGAYDHLGERACANALIITSTPPIASAWDAQITDVMFGSLTRSGQPYPLTASVKNTGTAAWNASNVSVVPSRPFGRTSSFAPPFDSLFVFNPEDVAPGETTELILNLISPVVDTDTVFTENFALWNTNETTFGPPDNVLQFSVTVRPELLGAPTTMIVQGAGGPNSQWYVENSGNWGNSSVSFSAEGVTNSGTQRFVSATSTGREAGFRPIFDVAGVYTVEVAFPSSSNNISVQYTVNHLNGSDTFTVNQNPTGGLTNTWHNLGSFAFGTGSTGGLNPLGEHSILVGNQTSTGNRFYSGAVRLDYVSTPSDTWKVR